MNSCKKENGTSEASGVDQVLRNHLGVNATNSGLLADGLGGFKIVAMTQSDVEQDGEVNEAYSGIFETARTTKKYLGGAAVKFFETEELASKYIDTVLLNAESMKELY